WYDANNGGDNNLTIYFYYSSDPDVLRLLYSSTFLGKAFNWSQVGDASLDDLLQRGLKTTDTAQRNHAYAQVQRMLMQDPAALPPFNQINAPAAAAAIRGYSYDLRSYPRYYDVSIAR